MRLVPVPSAASLPLPPLHTMHDWHRVLFHFLLLLGSDYYMVAGVYLVDQKLESILVVAAAAAAFCYCHCN